MSVKRLTRDDVEEMLREAREAGVRVDLRSLNLSGLDLSALDLSGANLRGANLSGADLLRADLSGADLRGANLLLANLRGANLLRADLSRTYLLWVTGLPSGDAVLVPLVEGWRLTVGCWSGSIADLRELIAQDDGWPEAEGEEIAVRRPMLAALADMAQAWADSKPLLLEAFQEKWGKTEAAA